VVPISRAHLARHHHVLWQDLSKLKVSAFASFNHVTECKPPVDTTIRPPVVTAQYEPPVDTYVTAHANALKHEHLHEMQHEASTYLFPRGLHKNATVSALQHSSLSFTAEARHVTAHLLACVPSLHHRPATAALQGQECPNQWSQAADAGTPACNSVV
jgi:hypothetical protein